MTAGRILISLILAAPASWALPLSLSSKKNVCKRGEHQLTLCFCWSSSAAWLMVWREKILLAWTQRVTWRIAVMYCLLQFVTAVSCPHLFQNWNLCPVVTCQARWGIFFWPKRVTTILNILASPLLFKRQNHKGFFLEDYIKIMSMFWFQTSFL